MRRYSLYLVSLLFVCVVMVLLFNSSSCYALSFEDIQTYVDNTANFYSSNTSYQQIKTGIHQSNLQSYLNSISSIISGYDNFHIYYYTYRTDKYLYFIFFNANSWRTGANELVYNGKYRTMRYNSAVQSVYDNISSELNSSFSNDMLSKSWDYSANQYNNLTGMTYTKEDIQSTLILPATYVGNQAMPQWIYLEFNNSMIQNTAYNGNIFTYYFKGNLYSQNQRKIGQIIPNDSYYYECRLYDYSQNIYIGYSYISLNVNPPIFYNDGALYINDNQEVFVNTINLDYSTQYRLDIVSYYGDGGSNLYEDDEWFIFLPLNASVSGDIILNIGSGDFTNQDSTMQLINSITEFTPFTNSGDIINNIDIVPIYTYSSGDSISTFFVDVLQHISDVFLLDEEVTLHLVLPIFSREINIRSDFWITHDYLPQLAEFINGAWWFVICLGMLYKIDVLVELYNFGDFITASYYIYQTRRLL